MWTLASKSSYSGPAAMLHRIWQNMVKQTQSFIVEEDIISNIVAFKVLSHEN